MSYYTVAAYVTQPDGTRAREILDPQWRMPYQVANSWAAELTRRYAPDRSYVAINVNQLEGTDD